MFSPGRAPLLPHVGPFTFGVSELAHEHIINAAPASATYETDNKAVYYPILVPGVCVVRRLWWVNGTSVSASYNLDAGIYTDFAGAPATRLVSSGSTAQGTASQVQYVDVTDTTLAPGRYWIALACSSTSATLFRSLSHVAHDAATRFEEASAIPLPASATPSVATNTPIYLFGFATTASP